MKIFKGEIYSKDDRSLQRKNWPEGASSVSKASLTGAAAASSAVDTPIPCVISV